MYIDVEKKFQEYKTLQNNKYEKRKLKYNQLLKKSANVDAGKKHTHPKINIIDKIVNDYNSFYKVANKEWEKEILKNVEIKVGNPNSTNAKVATVVIVEPQERSMENGIQRLYRDCFPELQNIEACECLEQEIKTTINNRLKKKRVLKMEVQEDERSV